MDKHLTRPARWRGSLRREMVGHGLEEERKRYVRAYNELIEEVPAEKGWKVDTSILCQIHDRAVGGDTLRGESLCAGRHDHLFPEPEEIPGLLEELFAYLRRDDIHPVVAATRAHLDLLTVHSFRDGNGRTARLVATLLLVRAGFRSSLFTAVEQFHHLAPATYIQILYQFDAGVICHSSCIARFLHVMAANSHAAAWFRERRARIVGLLKEMNVPEALLATVMRDFESGNCRSLWSERAERLLRSGGEEPWYLLNPRLDNESRVALAYQLERLVEEERDEAGR